LYSITLWDALKFEILNVQEEDLADEALTALKSMATQLSSATHPGPLQTYLKPVIKECNEHLEDTPTKQSTAAGSIMSAISKASLEASDMLGKGCLPQLFVFMKNADNLSRRRGFMEILNDLLQANLLLHGPWRSANVTAKPLRPSENPFSEFRTESIDAYTAALTSSPKNEVSFRLLALDGLRNLIMIRGLLEDLEVVKIIHTIDEVVIKEETYGKDEVKAAAMDALVQIALQKPQLVIDSSIPEFMAQLPDTDAGHAKAFVPILEALAKLSAEQQIFKTIMIRLKNKLYTALRQEASPKYVLAILAAMLYAFSSGSPGLSDPAVFGGYYQDIVIPLLQDLSTSEGQFASSAAAQDEAVLDLVGRICNVIVRSQQWVAQTEICRNVYTIFRQIEIEQVPPFTGREPRTMIVSTHLLAALQKEASPHTDIPALLTALVEFAISSSELSPAIQSATISQIAILVNKFVKPSLTATIITRLFTGPDSLLSQTNLTPTTLRISFAILRAITLRTDPQVRTFLPNFLALLTNSTYGHPAALAFSTLLAPDEILTKANHCILYALHKQRLFALSIPALASSFRDKDSSKDAKDNMLIAVSGILYWIPYELLKQQLPTLVPLLLQSLLLEDPDVKARTITIFEKIVVEDPKLVEEHVSSLVNRLLDVAVVSSKENGDNTSASIASAPKARAASLACLTAFVSSFKVEVLLPMKMLVGRRLMGALDDGRRVVRAEAVRCRRAWAGIGGEEEDER
jgi:DNA repair/transcription protein MET18/MMS19